MYFNRFDILEAWYLALSHCHAGQNSDHYTRLCKIESYFRPSPILTVSSLSDNAREIYYEACRKLLTLAAGGRFIANSNLYFP